MRDFTLDSFYVPTVAGLPFIMKIDDPPRAEQFQPIFDSDLRSRGFMTDPVIRPLVEALVPGGTFGVLKIEQDKIIGFLGYVLGQGIRVLLNPVAINHRRTDFDEVVLREGKLVCLELESEREGG
jgi:hypothetical protein